MSKPQTAKTAAEIENAPMSDFEKQIAAQIANWEVENTGFPPYFDMEVGKGFLGKVVALDYRDPKFPRIIFQATTIAIPCKRGPVDDAEEVLVKPGEFFTMSAYASCTDALGMAIDLEVYLKATGKRKLSGVDPRNMFDFEMKVSPEDKKVLNARRSEEMQAIRNRRTLGEGEVVQGRQLTA